nr:MAG TPA: hypothetical protein [Caudoviricetes sp.]
MSSALQIGSENHSQVNDRSPISQSTLIRAH